MCTDICSGMRPVVCAGARPGVGAVVCADICPGVGTVVGAGVRPVVGVVVCADVCAVACAGVCASVEAGRIRKDFPHQAQVISFVLKGSSLGPPQAGQIYSIWVLLTGLKSSFVNFFC